MVEKMKGDSSMELAAEDVAKIFFGEASSSDVSRIVERQSESDEYQHDFDVTAQLLADLEPLVDDQRLLSMVEKYDQKSRIKSGVWPVWSKMAVAAAMLVGVALTFLNIPDTDLIGQDTSRYVTRIGEQKTVELEDGSVINLNTGTQIMVTLTGDRREVILDRGEAYFDVAPDSSRPFTVNLGRRSVSVLGTEFNIFKTPEKFELAVLEGVVAIHDKVDEVNRAATELNATENKVLQPLNGTQYRVKAGLFVEVDDRKQELIASAPKNIQSIQSWRSGVIRFDEVPLSRVVQELNRYSAKKILIEDASVMDLRVFATVKVGRPNRALVALERLLPIRVIKHFDRIVIVKDDG